MNRFFVEQKNIVGSQIRITDRDDVHHAKKVLRLRTGEQVEISDSVSREYIAEIEDISGEEITLRAVSEQPFAAEPALSITLFQGMPKAGKMETILQKCTEIGVKEFVPVYTERSVVRENGKGDKKQERYQKIADEASKQCKRGICPKVWEPCAWKAILPLLEAKTNEGGYDAVLIPYEDEKGTTLKQAIRDRKPGKVAVIIGPEGGFTEKEVQDVFDRGGIPVSLGKTILRTETAGMATAAMLMYELEMN